MATLTRRQREALLHTLTTLERIQTFIMSDRIELCVRSEVATTALHYTRKYVPGIDRSPMDCRPLSTIAKDIGSDLALFPDALRTLKHVLEA